MKQLNAIYVGGPQLDPPDEIPLIHCKFCKKKSPRTEWVRNRWHCPGCNEEDAAGITEED
jgi:hypothetical protein